MAKKKMYTFSEKRQSRQGITSAVMGGLSLVIFAVLVYVSYWNYGEGGIYLGAFGLVGAFLSVTGLINGLLSFKEKHILHTSSKAGSILSSIALVVWMSVVLIGVS